LPTVASSDPSHDPVTAPPLVDRVSREFLLRHRVCPIALRDDGALIVAVSADSLLGALDDLEIAYDRPVVAELTSPEDLDLLIARVADAHDPVATIVDEPSAHDAFTSDVRDLANQPPVVRYVNLLIREAFAAGASDVHLESTRSGATARFRIDGVLLPGPPPPPDLDRAIVSRVKLLADLDIAERRRPQDGKYRVRLLDRDLDLRVSIIPTVFGESVVLRLLERNASGFGLDSVGMSIDILEAMRQLASRQHGMLLVTGPTGSGKTSTLYAALELRDAGAEKIITVEDPVEYTLQGIAQVPVNVQAGVTFATMLRSILRQDPDVILVGEMRDAETAELAVRAALTGHMVFSTLHTNDALGAIPRLLDLGIPPFLVAATLEAVLAQRLVRVICDRCKEPYRPEPGEIPFVHEEPSLTLYRGRGCAECRGSGYRGRTGIFELVRVSDDLRTAIVAGASRTQLNAFSGGPSLRDDGWAKVRAGITTIEEVLRATQQ
jgi:type II secretory ATPase GspE/PulE/Tfp pilus assembly ATPase PilB-like protein